MLIRISLILAIIAGLAVGALNFTLVKQKVNTLQTNLKTETEEHAKFLTLYSNTKRELDKTSAQLTQTNNALVAALTERDTAVAEADTATKKAADLSEKLVKATKELGDAKDELAAYQLSGFSPAQVLALSKELKALQDNLEGARDENKLLDQKRLKAENELAFYKIKDYKVPLPAGLQGKILVSDPKWDFVILNVGLDQGVLEHGELLVSRNGKLVGKVVVRSVQKDRSIANVLPGWKIGEVLEGDQVIPAYPAS